MTLPGGATFLNAHRKQFSETLGKTIEFRVCLRRCGYPQAGYFQGQQKKLGSNVKITSLV